MKAASEELRRRGDPRFLAAIECDKHRGASLSVLFTRTDVDSTEEGSKKMSEAEAQAHPTEPNQQTVERFFSAYATFLQAFQPVWMSPEVQQDGAVVYQKYAQVLQELMEHEIRTRMVDAWKAYIAIIEKSLSSADLQASTQEAYQTYLQSVRQAWVESDLEEMNALTLAAISQSLSMASWLAAASRGVAGRLSDGSAQSMSSV